MPAVATIDAALQMQLGNPSGATADSNNHSHYLIQRTVEALDYNDTLREPNWASWDLTAGDVGSSGRSSNFYIDTNLPTGFYRVPDTGYSGSGYDRGHMCPSADRTDNTTDNDLVFFMSNIIPQSPDNNQGVWANLETDCRSLAQAGNELLIICGPSGFGTNRTASTAQVYIPSNVWKIIVVVPLGSGTALSRITTATRVIAVNTPNIAGVRTTPWTNFLTSVNQLQTQTGFTFFSALPDNVATVLRAKVDGAIKDGITNISSTSGSVGSSVVIKGTNFTGASAVWFNGTNAIFTLNSANQITATVPPGATTGSISVIAAGGLATSAVNYNVVFTSPIQLWRQQWFGTTNNSGTAADTYVSSSDGMPNLLKYALGLNPLLAATNPITGDIATGFLRLTIPRNTNATDITYLIESVGDVNALWSTNAIVIDTNTPAWLSGHDTNAVPATSRRFIRLHVTNP